MEKWARFIYKGDLKLGKLSNDNKSVTVYEGDMFDSPNETDEILSLDDVLIQTPCSPFKMIALWNNYKALADEKGLSYPEKPLYIFNHESKI